MTDLLYAGFLGLVAGFIPVYMGLAPLGYLRRLSDTWRTALLSLSAGILLFLFADVAAEGVEFADAGNVPYLFVVGLLLGLLVPVAVSRRGSIRRAGPAPAAPADARPAVSGAAKLFTAYSISFGVGLHNFGEGLAIGTAYAAGALSLTTLLVLGFFLHNSMEGLGITAPIASIRTRWREPVMLGFLAGFPTVLGSMVGSVAASDALSALFFAAAAGALLFVIVELLRLTAAPKPTVSVYAGIALGVLVMYATGLLVP